MGFVSFVSSVLGLMTVVSLHHEFQVAIPLLKQISEKWRGW
jgi:hypothetical protein